MKMMTTVVVMALALCANAAQGVGRRRAQAPPDVAEAQPEPVMPGEDRIRAKLPSPIALLSILPLPSREDRKYAIA